MRTLPHGMPSACPTMRRTMCGICVDEVTVMRPPSICAKQMWFSMWQCCTVGVSYQPSTTMSPSSRMAFS